MHLDTAAIAAVLGLLGGWLVPALIARVPEPTEPVEQAEPAEGPKPVEGLEPVERVEPDEPVEKKEPKEHYADIARLPRLRPAAAVAGLALGGLLGLLLGWSWALVLTLPLVPIGIALAVVDWRTRLLPTKVLKPTYLLVIALILLGWAVTGDGTDVLRAAIGWLVAGGLYFVLWLIHPRGMGYGDVRLSGILGLVLGYLGWSELLVGVYGGFLLGGVIGGVLALLRRVDRAGYPFGPFMLLGALVGVVAGGPVISAIYP